jgi:TolA-binding protein
MQPFRMWILLLLLLSGAGTAWCAPAPAEQRAWAAAENSFQLGFWERAEKQFADFAEKFPKSENQAPAVLRQAQARCKQGRFSGAIELLTSRSRDAGALADEYQFWLAEAYFSNTNYTAAAAAYARLTRNFTNSEHRLEAGYNEALARSKLEEWPRVVDLLLSADGAFQQAAAENPTNELAIRGTLLLGEAQFAQNDLRAAEETGRAIAESNLKPELAWRRKYLLCRVQLADNRLDDALQGTTNLLALAAASGRRELQAESALLQGGILEQSRRLDEAIAAYETNLADDLPVERRRQALLKIVDLLLAQKKTAAAAQRLEKFVGENRKDKAADVALLTVGELHLKEYLASSATNRIELTAPNHVTTLPAFTNHLQQAFALFDWVARNFPRSSIAGKALLNCGWCLWLADQIQESGAAFQSAAGRLPPSLDQAVARYKWADCQARLGDFSGALTNYAFVLEKYVSLPAVKNELFEPALYQIVRTGLGANNLARATNALAQILTSYPDSFYCDRGMLLTGEKLNRAGDPVAAREILAGALKRFPQSPLAPEVRLAIARTYEQEKNWPAAVNEYDGWIEDYALLPARPQAEYSRAWATDQAGQATNALMRFTNFVAQFSTNELAPLAQNWVADFYLQLGDFKNAEVNYQLLFQKWPPSAITYQARLMAGRAAVARQGYTEAIGYFLKVINDKECPPDFVAQAFFEYGDATMRIPPPETNKLANFEESIPIYNKIPQLYPTNQLAPAAWGRIGDCYLQLATQDAKLYDLAIQAYKQAVESPRAPVVVRSQAEVGWGVVLEKQAAAKPEAEAALLKQAQEHYLNVALASNLRGDEPADPFWMKKAGLEAARVTETLGDWQQALNLYCRLEELLPPLKGQLEKKIARAQEHLNPEKN